MKVVVDTNVIVSGLLSSEGPPAEIVGMMARGLIDLAFDERILAEYRDVLLRKKFPFERDHVLSFLQQIFMNGEWVKARPFLKSLPDPTDAPFLEVALAAGADCLVTGNVKHYPPQARFGLLVVTPREFVQFIRSRRPLK